MPRRLPVCLTTLGVAALLGLAGCGSSSNPAAGSASSSSSSSSESAGSSSTTSSSDAVAGSAAAVSMSSGSVESGSQAASPMSSGSVDSGSPTAAPISSASGQISLTGCTAADLKTQQPGKFTVATDNPAYAPWFVDNTPSNGKGFESAVAFAVAGKLGYTKDQVVWIKESFNAAISPAPKNFDVDVNQFSITEDRKKAVDFSSSYYDVTQAVVTVKGSKIAGATTLAALKDAKLGAQIGTTSLDALKTEIAPTSPPTIFQTNDTAVTGLKNKQVDGIVVDLPTAFYMAAAQLDNGVIVGQLPVSGKSDQFGMLLDKGSPLTPCVSKAVDALRSDGTLKKLQGTWLTQAGAPELK